MSFIEENKHLIPRAKELMGMGFGRYKIKEMLGIKEHQARQLMQFISLGVDSEQKINMLDSVV